MSGAGSTPLAPPVPEPGGPPERVGRAVVAALLVCGLALLSAVSCHRAFQVDEVEHIHAAYHVRSGRALYAEVWQVHMPLLYGLLAPVVDVDDPRASYQRSRGLVLAMWLATALLAARCATRIAGRLGASGVAPDPALAGALTAGLLLWHTTFVERGMEVRPDGLLALCVTAALWLELDGRGRASRTLLAGTLLGLGLLATQKAVFATAVFGGLWLWRACRRRRCGPLLVPAAGWAVPVAVALAWIAAVGGLEAFWRDVLVGAAAAAGRVEERLAFSPVGFLVQEGRRNLCFSVLALVGLASFLTTMLRRPTRDLGPPDHRDAIALPAMLALTLLGTLWLQPFPWPYVHVGMLPPLAIVGAAAVSRALGRLPVDRRRLAWPLAALLVCLQVATAAPRLLAKASPERGAAGQQQQLALLEEVQRVTAADDPVFDLAGLYFRPDGYPAYALSGDLYRLYRAGGLPPMVPALRERGNVAFVYNYRVGWLRGEERTFLHEHYAHYTGNLFLHGRELSGLPADIDVPFEVLRTKRFRYDGPVSALLVDGQPFTSGELARGVHVLRLRRPLTGARLILDVPGPRPQRLPPATLFLHFD